MRVNSNVLQYLQSKAVLLAFCPGEYFDKSVLHNEHKAGTRNVGYNYSINCGGIIWHGESTTEQLIVVPNENVCLQIDHEASRRLLYGIIMEAQKVQIMYLLFRPVGDLKRWT